MLAVLLRCRLFVAVVCDCYLLLLFHVVVLWFVHVGCCLLSVVGACRGC